MFKRTLNYLRNMNTHQRVNIALVRAGLAINLRDICTKSPQTWEFSGFSQNGEDGILDYLTSKLKSSNRYFVEIGSSDGIENNTAWFAIAKKYSGMMVEGDSKLSERSKQNMTQFNLGIKSENIFINQENIEQFINLLSYNNPDIFSLDIDGNDYYIMESLFEKNLRPKICIVEYNSAFGPDKFLTIPYKSDFNFMKEHASGLYYGVSILAWKKLFLEKGYKFVTVDSRGVNAIFIDPHYFEPNFIDNLSGCDFNENFYQFHKYNLGYQRQFDLIKNLPFNHLQHI